MRHGTIASGRARRPVGRSRRATLLACALALAALAVATLSGIASAASPERGTAGASCVRPYTDDSPWNTPIGENPVYAPDSAARIAQINGALSSDPTQFTYPVYKAARSRKATGVKITQAMSQIQAGGAALLNERRGTLRIPLRKGAVGTEETGQLIVVDSSTGREWGVFGLSRTRKGWTALFGYRFSTNTNGIPGIGRDGAGLASRAGASYLAGLVRACEIAQGKIDHALSLAYDSPSIAYISPLRGTNGTDGSQRALPIGARVQLDPALTKKVLGRAGCKRACLTIARALQRYGAFVVGRSGRPKIYVEHETTAKWGGRVRDATVASIPVESLRALDLTGELRITRKLKHTKPRAGRLLFASVQVAPAAADAGSPGTVFCEAELGDGRKLEPVQETLKRRASGNERAMCAWRLPADARGETVNFLVHAVYQHGGARADLTRRIGR